MTDVKRVKFQYWKHTNVYMKAVYVVAEFVFLCSSTTFDCVKEIVSFEPLCGAQSFSVRVFWICKYVGLHTCAAIMQSIQNSVDTKFKKKTHTRCCCEWSFIPTFLKPFL